MADTNYNIPITNLRWALMFGLSRIQLIRAGIKLFSKSPRHYLNFKSSTLLDEVNIMAAVTALERDGIYQGLRLSQESLQEIINFALTSTCYGNGNLTQGFKYPEKLTAMERYRKRFSFAKYFNTARECPAIARLARDPQLLEIAERYLGTKPVHTGNRCWWNFGSPSLPFNISRGSHLFHFDLDDYRSIRFFFYLTDIDSTSGPHQCVSGSHRRKKIRHQLSLYRQRSDPEIIAYYGDQSIVQILGPPGYGFAEDTFCFHRGVWPISRDRLMIQIQFASYDYGTQHDRLPDERLTEL